MRLLIVDDHHEVRRLIRQMAKPSVCEVRECGDGREAIEAAREFLPHCVTLDVRLPGLSGIEAALGIRQVHPSARIAMVSSFDGPELRQAARLAGARCYMLKDHIIDLGPWLAEQAELRAMEEERACIAHDFNNLLAPIGMMVDLAQADNTQTHLASALVQIEAAVKRAQGLVQQLLLPRRGPRPDHGPVHLPGIVQEVIQLLQPAVPEAVSVQTHADPAGSWIRGNSAQMHQVLMNLLGNAVQAIGKGPGRIEVRIEALALPSGRQVRLAVTDTGCGMDAETQRRIFEPFFTTKSPAQGSGLGLASVRRIVTEHGGTIHVTSQAGQGSSFQIDLPAG